MFTKEEISKIEKQFGYIVFDWAKHLVNHVISYAKSNGVQTIYWNTSRTVKGGASGETTQYYYEKLPKMMGLEKETVNPGNHGEKLLWVLYLNDQREASKTFDLLRLAETRKITLEEIPASKQGAVLGIIGKKPYYTIEEIRKALEIIKKDKKKPQKPSPKFVYEWLKESHPGEWTGNQLAYHGIREFVITQSLPEDTINAFENDPVFAKFWALLLSQNKHAFGTNNVDMIGFALVSPVSDKEWLINEIQTDALRAYREVRWIGKDKDKSEKENNTISEEALIDLLRTNNRRNWIPYVESNIEFKEQLTNNPDIIHQLCDDSQNIEEFMENQRNNVVQGLDFHLAQTNFNTNIIRLY